MNQKLRIGDFVEANGVYGKIVGIDDHICTIQKHPKLSYIMLACRVNKLSEEKIIVAKVMTA